MFRISVILIGFLLVFQGSLLFSQSVGITDGPDFTPDASSLLELKTTTRGFLMPRMTAAQRNAIVSPAAGLMVVQTDNQPSAPAGIWYYYVDPNDSNNNEWRNVYSEGYVSDIALSLSYATFNVNIASNLATITGSWDSQNANLILASPDGVAGVPIFRKIEAGDISSINASTINTGTLSVLYGGTGLNTAPTANSVILGNTAGTGYTNTGAGTQGQVLVVNSSGVPEWQTTPLPTLEDGKLWIGNVSDVATAQTITGDGTISNAGVLTVTGINGTTISNVAPTNNQVLTFNSTSGEWEATTINATTIDGVLEVENGGTGVSAITGMVNGNGIAPMEGITNTAGNITYWSDSETIGGEGNLTWDVTNNILNIDGSVTLVPTTTAPLTPTEGQFYYDNTTNDYLFWNGTAWVTIGSTNSGSGSKWILNGSKLYPNPVNDWYSMQWGQGNSSANQSTAFGGGTASNNRATAWGTGTASANISTAWGSGSTASNNGSTAFGQNTIASGNFATAWGDANTASAQFSTSFGQNSIASGNYATAFGGSSRATADYAVAWGNLDTASGAYSTSFGAGNNASGNNSLATGQSTKSQGIYSATLGFNTIAYSGMEVVLGQYNTAYSPLNTWGWNTADRLFVLGNGINSSTKTDALVVYKDGNTDLFGDLSLKNNNSSANEIKLFEPNGGSEYSSFKSPSLDNNLVYTLPPAQGAASTYLQNDGSGNLSWASSTVSTVPFGSITTGTNTTATMTVSSGASLLLDGTGIVESSVFKGSGSTSTAVDLATAEVNGTLPVANGGTGNSTQTPFGVAYGNTDGNQLLYTPAGTTGQLLMGNTGGSPVWQNGATALSSYYWGLTGNSGTDSTVNFIGTSDNSPVVVKTNNTERLRVTRTGNVGIGGAPSQKLEVKDGNFLLSNSGSAGELRFQEPNGENFTAFKAQTQNNDHIYTLPANNTLANYNGSDNIGVLAGDMSGNDGNLQWISAKSFGGSYVNITVTEVNQDYTALSTDAFIIISTNNRTVTLPSAAANAGKVYYVAIATAVTSQAYLTVTGSDKISVETLLSTMTLKYGNGNADFSGAVMVSDGVSKWYVISTRRSNQ